AKETSKVILTGEGADELFSGYSRYRFGLPVRLADRLQRTGFPPQLVPPVGKLKTMRRLLSVDLLERVATVGTANNATDALLIDGGGLPLLEAMRSRFPDLLRQLIAVDQTAYLQSLFERQDRMSMAASVESRVPYCTPRLFAMANRWRPGGRFPGGEPKGVFKKIAGNVFPHKFVYRPKVGFNLPYGAWLRDERNLGQYLDLLTDETFRSRGFFDSSAIARMVDQHRNGRDDHAVSLLRLIFFEIWCRRFIGTTQSKSCPLISQVT
ncbi:MAG: asparagine synthase-related protein, partial [Halieaceae bacterium]